MFTPEFSVLLSSRNRMLSRAFWRYRHVSVTVTSESVDYIQRGYGIWIFSLEGVRSQHASPRDAFAYSYFDFTYLKKKKKKQKRKRFIKDYFITVQLCVHTISKHTSSLAFNASFTRMCRPTFRETWTQLIICDRRCLFVCSSNNIWVVWMVLYSLNTYGMLLGGLDS